MQCYYVCLNSEQRILEVLLISQESRAHDISLTHYLAPSIGDLDEKPNGIKTVPFLSLVETQWQIIELQGISGLLQRRETGPRVRLIPARAGFRLGQAEMNAFSGTSVLY